MIPKPTFVDSLRQKVQPAVLRLREVVLPRHLLYPSFHQPSASRYQAIRDLSSQYHPVLTATPDLTRFEFRVFSQNGEDGVIAEVLQRVRPSSFYFVEFGAHNGTEGNCVVLADIFGWQGLFIEADAEPFTALQAKYDHNPRVTTCCSRVTPTNINSLLESANAPREIDVLSIDVDGNDYWIWAAIQRVEPRLVVIEYNSALDPDTPLVQPILEESAWRGTDYFGASLGALCSLGTRMGYTFVHSDLTGSNAFFVRSDVAVGLQEICPPRRAPNYLLGGTTLPEDTEGRPYIDISMENEQRNPS